MFTSSRVKLLVITCAALFMAMLDNLVIGVALPAIQESFHATMSDLEWFMNAYTLAFSVLLIPFSVLGERFGRKRMFLTGIVLFTIGSALSGISESSIQLILSRALQGVGGAAIVPLSLTLVNAAFPPEKRAAALGIWSGISGLGLSVGPLIGGLIVEGAPWQLIFWVNVPVGILAFLLGLRWLPEAYGVRKPINLPSVLLLGAGLFGIVFGLERGNAEGWGSAFVLSCLIGGALLLALFYLWNRSRSNPLIRFDLFRRAKYTGLVLASFWMNAGIFCAIFLLTLFLQQAQGYSALGAGVREMVWTGCTMVAAPLAGLAVGKLGTRTVLLTGLLLQGGALLGFGLQILELGVDFPFGYMAPFMMMAGAGMGLSFTPISHGILSSVPESAAGEASGVNNAMRELGGVFGIAIGGLVFQSGAAVQSPADFGDHIVPALLTGAAMTLLSVLSVLAFYARRKQTSRQPQAANELG
ncbi:MFS transporter [Paenibacillus lycopersici]|uniref:MFS transporter n=1 Tax=Paenibacillus lycopersici TaxID=2704462 RepID=A0A6C0G777_9BACL|nr:MFS transporter [Paenibacillus lycopersici]QHT63175.1 MFS transporter [Paenibacillus lycopersici]